MAKTSSHEAKRQEAISLRTDGRLGTKEIHRRTGVPLSTLHYWLRPHPLTKRERSAIISGSPRYVAPRKQLSPSPRRTHASGLLPQDLCMMGESAVLLRLAEQGLVAARPVADCDVVDIYVRKRGSDRMAFIQARVASSPPSRSGLPTVSLRRFRKGKANRFKRGDFHFLVGYCRENGACYVYSFDEVAHYANSVTVSDEAAEAWWKVDQFLGEAA